MTLFRSAIFGLLLPFLMACSSEVNDNSTPPRRFGRESFDLGRCSQSPFAGLDFAVAKSSSSFQVSEYFGKVFAEDQLKSALPSSAFTIAKDLFDSGVEVHQVPSNSDPTCRYFDFLTEPPQVAQKNWNDANAFSTPTSQLLGLFTTIYSRDNNTQSGFLTEPTIMVLDSTQKWTLLHEMAHYLFAQARVVTPPLVFNSELDTRITQRRNEIQRQLRAYDQSPSAQTALAIVQSYRLFFDDNFELDSRTALEEFTIESMLLEYSAQDLISGIVKNEDEKNAIQYMKSNSRLVLATYDSLISRLLRLERDTFESKWPVAGQRVLSLVRRIQEEVQFIREKLNQFSGDETGRGRVFDHEALNDENLEPHSHHHYDREAFEDRHQMIQSDWD